jgi:CubicO group peptidase (beta-lactamase class C family)
VNRLISILAVLTIALAACDSADDPPSDPATTPEVACDPALDRAFGAWERAGFSGSVAILSRGRFECRAGYGVADRAAETPNTADTVFSIGSVSKAFTAAAILALVDAGRLRLRDRAGELVPGLDGPAAGVTVRQLLLHTSGLTGSLGDDHEPLGHDQAVEAIGGLDRAFEPGTDYAYSNAGYTLLALIVETVGDTTYRDYLASRILPLPDGEVAGGFWDGEPAAPGPRAVGYLDDGSTGASGDFAGPHWSLSGNGDLAMSMPELAAWTYALFDGRMLSPAATEAIGRPGFEHGDGTAETPGWVALDAKAYGQPLLTASGGGGDVGHDVVVAWLPETQRVIAVASNTPRIPAGDLLRSVAPALIAGEPLPTPRAPTVDVDPAELRAVAGRYRLDDGDSFEVSVHQGGRLTIAAHGPDAAAALFPGVSPTDVADHEARVLALLAGQTAQGRKERRALEAELDGPIDDIEPAGTIVDDGELRTYVTVRSASRSVLAWYALDEIGGVAAATIGADPPSLRLQAIGEGRFRPDDPAGTGPDLVVAFEGRRLTITGPAGTTSGSRAASG